MYDRSSSGPSSLEGVPSASQPPASASSPGALTPTSTTARTKRSHRSDEVDDDDTPTRKRKMQRKECNVCCNEIPVNRFPKVAHSSGEAHGRDVCFNCWEDHLTAAVESATWDNIRCAQCKVKLEEAEIRALAPSKVYQLWLDKAAKASRETNEEFIPCPSATCSWGCFFSTRDDGNIFSCRLCKYRYCVVCEVPMHEAETCNVYQERRREEEAQRARQEENKLSLETVSKVSKPCSACKTNLDKYTGCDHVTCSHCAHEFCWICFVPYDGVDGIDELGNAAHKQTCKWNPNHLPTYEPDEDEHAIMLDDYDEDEVW